MSNENRITELTDKLLGGNITADEIAELDRLDSPQATDEQKSYIFDILDQLGADLDDYTQTDWPDLTVREASELIDELKDERGY